MGFIHAFHSFGEKKRMNGVRSFAGWRGAKAPSLSIKKAYGTTEVVPLVTKTARNEFFRGL
jgi:hypothetical protein